MKPSTMTAVNEDTFIVEWLLGQGELPTPELAGLIGGLANYLLEYKAQAVLNVVPAYQTLMVQYDLLNTSQIALEECIYQWLADHQPQQNGNGKLHAIPVFYNPEVAPDLQRICTEKSLSIDALIDLHTSQTYTVYAVGFQPGFAYLGYVSEELSLPRLTSFRPSVVKGSVGIADRQTAVYPADSPGGWQIIGRAPKELQHGLLRAGDQVQFVSIDKTAYLELGGDLRTIDD